MTANIPHGKTVDAEPVILSVVATEPVIRDPIAVVTAALLPGAVLRLPAVRTITLPSDLLLAYMFRAPLLYRPIVTLLTLLALLILLPSGLLLLSLLILLPIGLLLLFRGVVLLLTLLALLILLPSSLLLSLLILLPIGLLLLFRGVVLLLTLLALLILLPSDLLLLFRGVVLLLSLLAFRSLGLLLLFRLSLLLLLPRLSLFFLLLLLPGISRNSDSDQQNNRCQTNDSVSFHGVTSIASTYAPVTRPIRRVTCQAYPYFDLSRGEFRLFLCHPTRIRESE
jgi:hypothetical protein